MPPRNFGFDETIDEVLDYHANKEDRLAAIFRKSIGKFIHLLIDNCPSDRAVLEPMLEPYRQHIQGARMHTPPARAPPPLPGSSLVLPEKWESQDIRKHKANPFTDEIRPEEDALAKFEEAMAPAKTRHERFEHEVGPVRNSDLFVTAPKHGGAFGKFQDTFGSFTKGASRFLPATRRGGGPLLKPESDLFEDA